MALALLDVIALKIDDTAKRKIYKLNSIKFNVTTEVKDNKEDDTKSVEDILEDILG